jgi:hypothetical protein
MLGPATSCHDWSATRYTQTARPSPGRVFLRAPVPRPASSGALTLKDLDGRGLAHTVRLQERQDLAPAEVEVEVDAVDGGGARSVQRKPNAGCRHLIRVIGPFKFTTIPEG